MKKTPFLRQITGIIIGLFCISSSFTAQDVELPSVTTTITGEAEAVDEEALPDFTQVLPPEEDVLPRLNDSRFSPEQNSLDLGNGGMNEDEMYLSGFFGGGFPGLFMGDFSIFKTSLKNPFTFHFLHASHNGYGMNAPSGGYYDSLTSLDGDASFTISENFTLKARGLYHSNSIGLQNQSSLFSSLSSQTIQSNLLSAWNFSNILSLHANLDGFMTNQYGSVKFSSADDESSSENPSFMTFLLEPSAGLKLQGSFLSFTLDGSYDFSGSVRSSEYAHRGSVYAGLSAFFEVMDAGIQAGGVFLDNMQLMPFNVFVSFRGKSALSDKELSVTIKGGLDSHQASLLEMQKEHLFTLYNTIPSEQSDWFGDLALHIPFADVVSTDINLGFASTAFGNGVLQPDYETSEEQTSLFNLAVVDRNAVYSDIALKYSIEFFSLALGWKASWLDISVIEPRQVVYLNTFVSSKGSKLRSSADIEFEPLGDLVPNVSLGVFYSITPSFSLALEIEDVVKLVSGSDRIIVPPYISRSGSALLTAKFYF